jgi:hypothetical protein
VALFIRSTSRRMDNDTVLLSNCSNGLDSRRMSALFSYLVECGEHAIEAGARHREHQEARRSGTHIAIAVASMARGKEKCASAKTQWIGQSFDFNKHFATQHIECVVLTSMRVCRRAAARRHDRFPYRELPAGIARHRLVAGASHRARRAWARYPGARKSGLNCENSRPASLFMAVPSADRVEMPCRPAGVNPPDAATFPAQGYMPAKVALVEPALLSWWNSLVAAVRTSQMNGVVAPLGFPKAVGPS